MTSHWQSAQATSRPLPLSEAAINQIIIGSSARMGALKKLIAAVAVSDAPVMISGETGAGKELVAEAIHKASGRKGPLIAVNCAAIPSELLESELFGHEKGAFTGADRPRMGLIEQAAGGSLFLDEIGDMPAHLQSKLLRVLEAKSIQRLGSGKTLAVDFRLITATHRDLEGCVSEGQFRADLYFRIAVFPLDLPALRERVSDIPQLLARMITQKLTENPALDAPHFDASALRELASHKWPGNVRELRNLLQRAFVLFPGKTISARHVRENLLTLSLPAHGPAQETPPAPVDQGLPEPSLFHDALTQDKEIDMRGYLRDIEVAMIEAALSVRRGSVSAAAGALRLRRTTLIEKMKKYGIDRQALC